MYKISVVVPLYNKADYIGRALESVFSQTVQNFEVVVIDDGSTDNGAEIVKNLRDTRIRLLQQSNAGVSAARNRGIEEGKADLIAFIDADDEWKPTFLETILRLREKYGNAGAYATGYEIKVSSYNIKKLSYKGIPPYPWEGLIPRYFYTALSTQPVWSSAVAIPKLIFEKVGGFPVGEHLAEDLYMFGKIAIRYSIAFSSRVEAVYHQDATNRACKMYSRERSLFAEYASLAIKDGQVRKDILADLKEYIDNDLIFLARKCILLERKPEVARKLLSMCSYGSNFRLEKYFWLFGAMIPNNMIQLARECKKRTKAIVRSLSEYKDCA